MNSFFIFAVEMKCLIFITSFYFLFLAVHPCHCDLGFMNFCIDNTENIVLNNSDDHSATEDACTPFCACSNVHNSNFIINNTLDIHFGACTSVTELVLYDENKTMSCQQNFWRPPQA